MSEIRKNLEVLKEHKNALVLAEMTAYLHMLGKVSKELFLEYYDIIEEAFDSKEKLNLPSKFFNLLEGEYIKENFHNYANAINLDNEKKFPDSLKFFSKCHRKNQLKKLFKKNITFITDDFLARALFASHHESGEEEKNLNNLKNKNNKPVAFSSSPFGYEYLINYSVKEFIENREKLCMPVQEFLEKIKQGENAGKDWYEFVNDTLKKVYSNFLADTQRPINDITLWDACYLVAAFMKPQLAYYLLKDWKDPIIIKKCKKDNKEKIDVQINSSWRILSINIPVYNYISKGIKVGDVIGREKLINKAFCKIKKLLERDYPLGNELHRDLTGIYFSFPDIEKEELKELIIKENNKDITLWEKVKQIIVNIDPEITFDIELSNSVNNFKNEINKVIKEGRKKAEYVHINSSVRNIQTNIKGEVCSVCRLRGVENNTEKVCSFCQKIKKERLSDWEEKREGTSIWLDEISDRNGRIALIAGKFALKNWFENNICNSNKENKAEENQNKSVDEKNKEDSSFISKSLSGKSSSSGRVRRIWQTTQDFIDNSLPNCVYEEYYSKKQFRLVRIKLKLKDNITPQDNVCDVKIKGVRYSAFQIKQDEYLLLNNIEAFGFNLKKVKKFLIKSKIQINVKNEWIESEVEEVRLDSSYKPWIKLYSEPEQFMYLIPAQDAFDIVQEIKSEFDKHFSKVKDRLPLHLGLVIFEKHQPLYAVMDAGKRMINRFSTEKDEKEAEVEEIENNMENNIVNLKFKIEEEKYNWRVNNYMGDKTEDKWHCHIQLGNNAEQPEFKYIKELKKGEKIKICMPCFSYVFMENNFSRIKSGENLLWWQDLDEIETLWREIKNIKDMTVTKLQNIYSLLLIKDEEWNRENIESKEKRNSKAFEQLVEIIMEKDLYLKEEKDKERWRKWILGKKQIFVKSLEIHLKILKERLGSENAK